METQETNYTRTCQACAGEGAAVGCAVCNGEGLEPAPVQHRVRIIADSDPFNPRTERDNFGVMYCEHGRYTLGDKDAEDPRDPDSDDNALRSDVAVSLPLYLYDHSGITMSCGPFSCPWDSGCVGIIYATRAQVLECFGVKRITKKILARAEANLRGEVKEYDYFLTGQCYGFILERGGENDDGDVDEWEHVDSCYGFLGPIETNGMLDHLDPEFHALAKNAEVEYGN